MGFLASRTTAVICFDRPGEKFPGFFILQGKLITVDIENVVTKMVSIVQKLEKVSVIDSNEEIDMDFRSGHVATQPQYI